MIEILSELNSYYSIQIKLPLRTYIIKKRYSDFETLVNDLSYDLGIDYKDFPYQLPGKRLNWLNKANIIEERKIELAKFLNRLVNDKDLQNHQQIRQFLQLPNNFKFQWRSPTKETKPKEPEHLNKNTNPTWTTGRVIGKETSATIPLSNKELLQEQVNIHHAQDQEVEQLRYLLSRQRQIGELINTEVEEQNYLLDQFNEEVDQTSDKVKKARTRARRII